MGKNKRARKAKSFNKQRKKLEAVHTATMAMVSAVSAAQIELLRMSKANHLFKNHLITKESFHSIVAGGVLDINKAANHLNRTSDPMLTPHQELDLRGIINTGENNANQFNIECKNFDIEQFKSKLNGTPPPDK